MVQKENPAFVKTGLWKKKAYNNVIVVRYLPKLFYQLLKRKPTLYGVISRPSSNMLLKAYEP
jgi:hypothetical protein